VAQCVNGGYRAAVHPCTRGSIRGQLLLGPSSARAGPEAWLSLDLEELDRVEIGDLSARAAVGVEQQVRLAGEGIAQVPDAGLINDQVPELPVAEGDGIGPAATSGMSSENSTE
jgi:hypothetical protein